MGIYLRVVCLIIVPNTYIYYKLEYLFMQVLAAHKYI